MTTISDRVVQFGTEMMPLGPGESRVRVHLGHDERHVGVHPERAGLVDHDDAARRRDRCPLRRDLVWHVEHREVDAVEGLGRHRLNLDLLAPDRQHPARRPRRGDQPDLAPDVRPGGHDLAHDGADRARRPDDREDRARGRARGEPADGPRAGRTVRPPLTGRSRRRRPPRSGRPRGRRPGASPARPRPGRPRRPPRRS